MRLAFFRLVNSLLREEEERSIQNGVAANDTLILSDIDLNIRYEPDALMADVPRICTPHRGERVVPTIR